MSGLKIRIAPIYREFFTKLGESVDEMQEVGEEMLTPYMVGESVKVISGPFSDLSGIIEEVHSDKKKLRKNLPVTVGETPLQRSAKIIWNQLQHIAVLLDKNGSFAWGITALGSDFDGSINPFPGILTVGSFEPLAKELIILANRFLAQKKITLAQNTHLSAEDIIDLFMYGNTERFMKEFF